MKNQIVQLWLAIELETKECTSTVTCVILGDTGKEGARTSEVPTNNISTAFLEYLQSHRQNYRPEVTEKILSLTAHLD